MEVSSSADSVMVGVSEGTVTGVAEGGGDLGSVGFLVFFLWRGGVESRFLDEDGSPTVLNSTPWGPIRLLGTGWGLFVCVFLVSFCFLNGSMEWFRNYLPD